MPILLNHLLCSGTLVSDFHIAYRTESQFVAELQGGIRTNSNERILGELCQVPWLVLDEMFISGVGNWTTGKLDELIHARWEGAGPLRTLITTNATLLSSTRKRSHRALSPRQSCY